MNLAFEEEIVAIGIALAATASNDDERDRIMARLRQDTERLSKEGLDRAEKRAQDHLANWSVSRREATSGHSNIHDSMDLSEGVELVALVMAFASIAETEEEKGEHMVWLEGYSESLDDDELNQARKRAQEHLSTWCVPGWWRLALQNWTKHT